MDRLRTFHSWLVASVILAAAFTGERAFGQTNQKPYVIIGYIAGWAWPKETIAVEKMTHINYAFATVGPEGELAPIRQADTAHLKSLVALRTNNPDLKILISIGGWSGCKYFSDAALTADSRRKFADSAVVFVKKHDLDGIDIDWEFPAQIGDNNHFRPEDKQNYTLMLQALRERLDQQGDQDHRPNRYQLTVATGNEMAFVEHTELGNAQKYLDYVNLMGYDIYNGNDLVTGHHANLYQSASGDHSRTSVDAAVREQLDAGVPAAKLVLGLPFYGRGWTEVNDKDRGLYQPCGGKTFDISYDHLAASYINQNGYVRYWDDAAKVPYLWNAESRTFITYPDEESFGCKMDYVKSRGLAGVMFWEYNQQRKQMTLLNALYDGLRKP